ncbi:tetratricopeptide repeat protein [Shewanella cyperi]|uniref:tetratricopeptide repeat protein n=1 Tax=Shewanella cyperi TaxID=2814292 RepID=UPI001A94DCFF|nr:tetratricopeptide repeat protein [Shewanella cyperi]QSX41228.1 tetratricopeptide repeat protein [Shewanella cyperi]
MKSAMSRHQWLLLGIGITLILLLLLLPSDKSQTQVAPPTPQSQKIEALLALAASSRNEEPQKTLEYGEQALALLAQSPDAEAEVMALSNLAWAKMMLGQFTDAARLGEQALSVAETQTDQTLLVVPLNVTGLIYWRQSQLDKALTYYQRALTLAKELGKPSFEATTYINMGLIYSDKAEYQQALECFSKARDIHSGLGEERPLATALNNIAGIYAALGDFGEALANQQQALRIREQLDDRPGIAELHHNIGITYEHIGDLKAAKVQLQTGLAGFEALGDKTGMAQALNALGTVNQKQQQYDAAKTNMERALAYGEELNDGNITGEALLSLGKLHLAQGDPQKARRYLERGLAIADRLGLVALQAEGRLRLADYFLAVGLGDLALERANQALQQALASGDRSQLRDANALLAQIYERKGDFRQALASHKEFKSINDALFNSASQERLAWLRSSFEDEKRQRQIAQLERDKALQDEVIRQQRFTRNIWIVALVALAAILLLLYGRHSQARVNHALQRAILMQRNLMQAVAHEFRAPLARVQLAFDMLLEADAGERPQLEDRILKGLEELDELIREIVKLIKAEGSPRRAPAEGIELAPLLETLVARLQPLFPDKQVGLSNAGPELQIMASKKHFEWLINNLLSNALRYSREQVQIACSVEPGHISIVVDDDGPGVPEEERERIFEPFVRLDPSRTRATGGVGLGLAIARRLAENGRGHIEVSDSPLGGARFKLIWPR